MRVALINGSPKGKHSASKALLDYAKNKLPRESVDLVPVLLPTPKVDENIIRLITSCNVLLWAFPLYVDAVPSHLLPWLLELERAYQEWEGPRPVVYALVNCGFYEAEHNEVLLAILKNWCSSSRLKWGQGLAIGAGGVLHGLRNIQLGKWPFQRLERGMDTLISNLGQGESASDVFINLDFPPFAYKLVAEFGWRRSLKRNGLKLRDLHRRIAFE